MHPQQDGGLFPKTFEVVIVPLRGRKDVDNHIVKVQQHPAGFWLAFDMPGMYMKFFGGSFLDRIQNRFDLSLAVAGTQDEVVRKHGLRVDVHQDDVFAFFVFDGIHQSAGQVNRFFDQIV